MEDKRWEEERLREQIRQTQQAKEDARARVDALRAEVQRAQHEADSALSQENRAKQESSKAFDNVVKSLSKEVDQESSVHTAQYREEQTVPVEDFKQPPQERRPEEGTRPPYLANIHIESVRKGNEITNVPTPGSIMTLQYEIPLSSVHDRSALGRLVSHQRGETFPFDEEYGSEEVSSPSEFDYIALYKLPREPREEIHREDVWELLNPQQDHYKVEFLDPLSNIPAIQRVISSLRTDERPDSFEELFTALGRRTDMIASSAVLELPSVLEGTVSMTLPSEEGVYFTALVTSQGYVAGVSVPFRLSACSEALDSPHFTDRPRRTHKEPSATTEILGPSLPAVPSTGPFPKERFRRPNFCLEKQPKISVYQLYIHVPGLKDLPKAWCPAFSVRNGCLLAYFSIPEELANKYSIQPRQFFLKLSFPYRLELERGILHIREDHVSLRLPLYYRGEAVPDRKQRHSRKQIHEEVAKCDGLCRFCMNKLWLVSDVENAFDLPSSNWHEWSEFWLCHSNERGHLLPREDVTARPHSIGIADRCLMLHPVDIMSSGCKLSFHNRRWDINTSSSILNVSTDTVNLKTFTWDTFSRAARLSNPGQESPELAAIRCRRCRCLLGICVASLQTGVHRSAVSLNEVFPKCFSSAATRAEPQPSLYFFSDKVTLDAGQVQSAPLQTSTEFYTFSPAHRLSSDLFSLSNAYSIYRFFICPSSSLEDGLEIPAHVSEVGLGTCIALGQETGTQGLLSRLLGSDSPALAITVLNWNTSMSGHYQPYIPKKMKLLSEVGDTLPLACWENGDSPYPAMKVRYLCCGPSSDTSVEGSTRNAISRGKLKQWAEYHQPHLWTMFPEDFRLVCRMLAQSTEFLPPTSQEDQSMRIGFLPMVTSLLH
eukprot:gb/GECG01008883.1/.p1 GENE.gb/GECG01008883.1/~~gb/GECG01008883.1/.p1  ORF type:complete len:885 (+),score=84.52 gb/GECG01008883.1/:1-2655(+)